MLTITALLAAGAVARAAQSAAKPTSEGRYRPRNTAVVRTLAQAMHSVCLHLLAWQMRRMNKTVLHSLDEHTLRDIGLHRRGIEATVRDIDVTLARRKRAALRFSRQGAWAAAVRGGPRRPQAI
jgi:uncharacterized protein YjiS (DUF1127 family)